MVMMTLRGTRISSLLDFLLGQQGHTSGGKSGAASQPFRKHQLSLQAALSLLFGLALILSLVSSGHWAQVYTTRPFVVEGLYHLLPLATLFPRSLSQKVTALVSMSLE